MKYPLVQEIPFHPPAQVFALFATTEGAVLLDSSQQRAHVGQYSFIALAPFLVLSGKDGQWTCNGKKISGNPFDILAAQLSVFTLQNHPGLPPFQGGVAGFLSYDLCHQLEKLTANAGDELAFPDLQLGFYDLVIAFDLEQKKSWIFSSGYPEQGELRSARATTRLAWLLNKLKLIPDLPPLSPVVNSLDAITANFTSETYQLAVNKVINYILDGDIFEANISQRFQTPLPENLLPFDLYRRLQAVSPAPFAGYIVFQDVVLASASPERFLKLTQGTVEARPIKGTRPRGSTPEKDAAFATELATSAKDHAENIMIVDLLRNDLSRVCKDHSVQVTQLCGLESYATVHHLVSVVSGELQENLTAIDLLRAAFPGGSITGAPKVRAMEIIAEVERNRRGPYCGSIGYIGFNGDMDFSITIRTFAIKNAVISFQVGGAVVADSEPVLEYAETLTKASALLRALTVVP